MRFEALEQTLRLRLVSGPVDKKFFFISRNSLSHTVHVRVPTSEREGKLSNLRARRVGTMHGENLQKFTETRARPPRARNAFISLQPRIQYSCTKFSTDLVSIALVVLTSIRIVDFCARSTISTLIKCA